MILYNYVILILVKKLTKKDAEALTSASHLTLTSSFMKRKLSLL